ncbi:MAG: patatin-like phospholipase family protein [Nitrospirota bacterium]
MSPNVQYPSTVFFQACRGVFEGGGCRGAAHVGAYKAAIQCGVNFSEVAGTSAGSIIAVLIGAGADPQFLLNKTAYLKFRELLAEPQGRISTPWLGRVASPFLLGRKRLLGKVLLSGSAYSSEKLEEWLDQLLAELLPGAQRPIKFKDLILPTWVVATDLAGRRPKVWSKQETPDETVAMAVRSSCSIPLFFEPVESGNALYVDGGMLSNLPSFVFASSEGDAQALGGRILAFRLVGNETPMIDRTLSGLVLRLIDAAISGATKLQTGIQSNISSVEIKTGDISSTNFEITEDEVRFLLEAGESAVVDFIRNEHTNVTDSLSLDVARYGDDELYDDLVREMATPGKRLVVSCADSGWFWKLFPSVIHWMFAGAAVDILIKAGSPSARERQRRRVLKKLGARIVEASEIPLSCFVLSRVDDRHNAAFVLNISETPFSPKGAVYIGIRHRPVIDALLKTLDQLIPQADTNRPGLRLERGNPESLIRLLKEGVNQYSTPSVSIEMQEVPLDHPVEPVQLVVRRVRSFKYRQIGHLVTLYNRYSIPFCEPADIFADGQYVSTVTPPVFEKWQDSFVAVEGNTRVFYLNRAGLRSVSSLVVSGVSAPLPGVPVSLREVLLATCDLPLNERIKDFNYGNFRSIEGAARPES